MPLPFEGRRTASHGCGFPRICSLRRPIPDSSLAFFEGEQAYPASSTTRWRVMSTIRPRATRARRYKGQLRGPWRRSSIDVRRSSRGTCRRRRVMSRQRGARGPSSESGRRAAEPGPAPCSAPSGGIDVCCAFSARAPCEDLRANILGWSWIFIGVFRSSSTLRVQRRAGVSSATCRTSCSCRGTASLELSPASSCGARAASSQSRLMAHLHPGSLPIAMRRRPGSPSSFTSGWSRAARVLPRHARDALLQPARCRGLQAPAGVGAGLGIGCGLRCRRLSRATSIHAQLRAGLLGVPDAGMYPLSSVPEKYRWSSPSTR